VQEGVRFKMNVVRKHSTKVGVKNAEMQRESKCQRFVRMRILIFNIMMSSTQ